MIPDHAEQRRLQAEFLRGLAARLDEERRSYGYASLRRPASELCAESQEELLDVSGEALWLRLRTLEGGDP